MLSLKDTVKQLPTVRSLHGFLRRVRRGFLDTESLDQQLQQILINQYRLLVSKGELPRLRIAEAGFRCYSQFEEDGIILYVLSVIGMKTRKVVEMCCGDGSECMASNLILNHGFTGYLFDGRRSNIKAAEKFFRMKPDSFWTPPKLRCAWISQENVNDLLREAGATGEVDLFSLDLDGNDYYIWEAITEINPRLCVFETHNPIPGHLSLTMPYDPVFDFSSKHGSEREFRSVSLLAMKKLSESKGYRMIGAHRHGFNVFFLRNDIGTDFFPEVTVKEVHDNYATKLAQSERWPLMEHFDWRRV